jgi:hypothetical protein
LGNAPSDGGFASDPCAQIDVQNRVPTLGTAMKTSNVRANMSGAGSYVSVATALKNADEG